MHRLVTVSSLWEALPSFTDVWVELELNKPSAQILAFERFNGFGWKTTEQVLKADKSSKP